MTYIQNLFTSRDNKANAATNIGQSGRLWYDSVTNSLYVSDGSTPGGILISGGGGTANIAVIPAVYFTALANGNNQTFSNTVLGSYTSNIDITLFYNGSLLENTFYTLSGDTLTINTPLVVGDSIDIIQQFANAQAIGGYGNTEVVSLLNTGLAGNIIPAANVTYSLGNATNQWASVYVGANTLYINSVPVTVDGNTLQVNGSNVVTISGTDAISVTGNVTANYFIGNGSQLTGLTGFVGATGPTGSAGATGPQGQIGSTGLTGITGATGVGQTGATGIQGPEGLTGATGAEGLVGATGAEGLVGATGESGTQGATGIQGPTGGSASFYSYNTDTVALTGEPSTGTLLYNTVDQTLATQININHLDSGGIDVDLFLLLLKTNDTIIIQDSTLSNNFQTYRVTSAVVPQTNYVELSVTLTNSGGTGTTGFANAFPVILIIVGTGLTGATGLSGATGPAGPAGATGPTGLSGATGIGATGLQGLDGATGPSGLDGATGTQGVPGLVGATGLPGITGATGTQGLNGATGSTGLIGSTGITGNTGATGITGNTGATGPVAGSNTYVVFNDAGTANGTAGFTFNKSSNLVTVAGNITGGNISTAGSITSNSTAIVGGLQTVNIVSSGNISSDGDIYVGGSGIISGTFATTSIIATGNINVGGTLTTSGITTTTFNVAGNITGGNILTNGIVSATGISAGNSGFTTVAGITSATLSVGSVSATGNIAAGNVITTGLVQANRLSATGNVSITASTSAWEFTTAGDLILPSGSSINKVTYNNVPLNSTMGIDNIRLQLQSQNSGIWLFGATAAGTATWSMNTVYSEGTTSAANAGSISAGLSATTSFQSLITTGGTLNRANVKYIWTIIDITAGRMYCVNWQTTTGTTPYGSYVTIERL